MSRVSRGRNYLIVLVMLSAGVLAGLSNVNNSDRGTNKSLIVKDNITSNRYPFRLGKIQRGVATGGEHLSVVSGEKLDYWESPTFQARKIQRAQIETSLPEEDKARFEIRVSDNPQFGKDEYNSKTIFSENMTNGTNKYELGDITNKSKENYFRIFFGLEDNPNDPEPKVNSFKVQVVRNSSKLLMVHAH